MWTDFSQMFAKMEPSLPAHQLEELWRTFDEDGNGGVDRNEFIRGLTIQTAKPVASDVCQRVLTALSREGMTADQLFTALAKDVGFVLFHDFSAMFAKLEPSLSTQQLQNLWQTFDADGNGGVDRDEFIRGLSQQDAPVTFPRDAAAYDTGAGVGVLAGTPAGSKRPAGTTMSTPSGAIVDAGHFWSAFRRIRSALHGRNVDGFRKAFDMLLPSGITRLPSSALSQGLSHIGCRLSEGELNAFFAAMALTPQEGATFEEFATTLSVVGEGFDDYGREVLAKAGAALSMKAGGSLRKAFQMLDVTGSGGIQRSKISEVVIVNGDINLTEGQLERLWHLATIGQPGATVIDYPTFNRAFQPAAGLSAGPASSQGFQMTLEEACVHLASLNRTEALKVAFARASSDGYLPANTLSALLQAAAPELTTTEVEQILRLAPKKGGPVNGEDAHDWGPLISRFEGGRGDWDPVEPSDRILTAEVCLWITQQVEQQNYRSFQDFVAQASGSKTASLPAKAASLPAKDLLKYLQQWLPGTKEQSSSWQEFQRIAEFCIMRFGTISPNGNVDLAEFYARFDRLAKGGPAAAIRAPAAPVSPDVETDFRVCSQGPACPVDFSHISVQRLSDISNRLQYVSKEGRVAFDKMHGILEDLGVQVSRRMQGRLKQWLGEPVENLYYWPPLLAFTLSIDRITVTADKHTRMAYPRLQLQASFCGEVVKFPAFGWSTGMMQAFEPKKMTRTLKSNARFHLDGPWGISPQDLAVAMSEPPPPTHVLRISLFGSDSSALDTSRRSDRSMCDRSQVDDSMDHGSYSYHLGSVDLWMKRDVPKGDIQPGGRGSEKIIKWHLPIHNQGPRLHAVLNISTHNAGRVPFLCRA